MKQFLLLFVLILLLPCISASTTSKDIRSRVIIDGRVLEYETDEWVLDATSDFPETRGDSRWGKDNDIHGIALTWDLYNLYIAVPCVAFNSTLMLFIDAECGGVDALDEVEPFRRNIIFSVLTPNFIVAAEPFPQPVAAAAVDCRRELALLESERISAWFLQDGLRGGALEVAIPWEELGRFDRRDGTVQIPETGAELSLLAVITGDAGSGAGDAAPDPASILENDPARPAVCDNAIRIPLDADGDRALDLGISPREAASVFAGEAGVERQILPFALEIAQKVIAPEKGETLKFRPLLELDAYPSAVYLTARVFSSSGTLVDVIFEETPRQFTAAAPPVWDHWDGRDFHGNLVPGGVYILTISGGAAMGAATDVVRGTFAVIR